MKRIKIGKISGAQGLKGEVKMYHDSGDDEALGRLSSVFIGRPSETGETEFTEKRIESLRMHRRTPILGLEDVADRDTAEALVGAEIYADEDESRPDEEGAYLVSDLMGLAVQSENFQPVGSIKNVISNPAHDILEIETGQGIYLLPFIDVFVKMVDIKSGIIIIDPPENWMG